MKRYDPFEEMDRMFEQLRTRVWSPEGAFESRGRLGSEGRRFGTDDRFGNEGRFDSSGRFGTEGRFGTGGRSDSGGRLGTGGFGFEVPALSGERESLAGGVNMDLTKHDDEYVFVADLPGFEREEIDLTFADGVLTIVAESEMSDEIGDEQMEGEKMTTESDEMAGDEIAVRGRFARSRRVAERVTIPEEVLEDEITASYRNGVLEVYLPIVESEGDDEDGKQIDISD